MSKKTVQLLLENGSLDGFLTVGDSAWKGAMFVSPYDNINQLLQKKEMGYYGVYLLLSDEEVYIGQTQELQKCLKQHERNSDFWTKCVLLTTNDDSLNKNGIDYIEANFIDRAKKVGKLNIENKKNGNKTNINVFDKAPLDNYINGVFFLLELIGITVFKKQKRKRRRKKRILNSMNTVGTHSTGITRRYLGEGRDWHPDIASITFNYVTANGGDAKMKWISPKEWILFKGSKIGNTFADNSSGKRAQRLRKPHRNKIVDYELIVDVIFPEANQVSQFVYGRSVNAWFAWVALESDKEEYLDTIIKRLNNN